MKLTWKPLAAGAVAIVLLIGIIAAVAGRSGASGTSSSDKGTAAMAATGPAPAAAPAVFDTWKQAGLNVSAFTPSATSGKALGGDCQSGTVGGLDVVVCTYPDDAAAKRAEDKGFAAVGETTGVAMARGSMLLVAAD